MIAVALVVSALVSAPGFKLPQPPKIEKRADGRQLVVNGPILAAWQAYNPDFLPWGDKNFSRERNKDCGKKCGPQRSPWALIVDVNGDGALDVLVDGFVRGEKGDEIRTVLFLSNGLLHYSALELRNQPLDEEAKTCLARGNGHWEHMIQFYPAKGKTPWSFNIDTPQSDEGAGGGMCNYTLVDGKFEESCEAL